MTSPGNQMRDWLHAYHRSTPLHLSGTGWIRAPEFVRSAIATTVRTIQNGCDTFVTLGVGQAWYMFADRRPPTGFNQPAWPTFLDAHEQHTTVTAIARSTRICLVLSAFGGGVHDGRVVSFAQNHSLPLVRYLERTRWTLLGQSLGVQVLRAIKP